MGTGSGSGSGTGSGSGAVTANVTVFAASVLPALSTDQKLRVWVPTTVVETTVPETEDAPSRRYQVVATPLPVSVALKRTVALER